MRKFVFLGIAGMMALAAFITITMLPGQGTGVANAGAIVVKDTGLCGMPGADAAGNLIFGGSGVATTVVENKNKVMIKCKGDGITNLSGSGQNYAGFGCGISRPSGGFTVTTDSHATVSASGVGTLTCSSP